MHLAKMRVGVVGDLLRILIGAQADRYRAGVGAPRLERDVVGMVMLVLAIGH